MAPWLRMTRVTGLVLVAGLLVVLVTGAVPVVYAAGPFAHTAEPEPGPATSRAGSRAGEGRERPGRRGTELADPEHPAYAGSETPSAEMPTAEPDDPGADVALEPSRNAELPVPSYAARPGSGTTEKPVFQVLSLGSGLMLVGLGLGLAFVGLRIRRS